MLKEEQVSELLLECERLVEQPLVQIRGNLTKAENRSAAIFELLAIQAFAALGKVEYEPFPNSPDIRLTLPDGAQAWVEVAFLYDKYWKQERQSRELTMAMRKHAEAQGVAPEKISLRFSGEPTAAGYERRLPEQHEIKKAVAIKSWIQPPYRLSIGCSEIGGNGDLDTFGLQHFHCPQPIIKRLDTT